jgi:hypothetical protein
VVEFVGEEEDGLGVLAAGAAPQAAILSISAITVTIASSFFMVFLLQIYLVA